MNRKTSYPNIDKLISDGATKVNTDGATSDYVVLVKNGEQVKMTLAEFITFLNANGIGGSAPSQIHTSHAVNVSPSTTSYISVSGSSTGESFAVFFVCPRSMTFSNLYVLTSDAQGAGGSLVITIRKNSSNTTLTTTIPAGGAAGQYTDVTHSFTAVAGDVITIQATNNWGGGSAATLRNISMKVT